MSWDLLNKFEKKESDDWTNLLYTLHISPAIGAIGIKEIAEHTSKYPIRNELRELIKSGNSYILKSKPNLNPYREILSEITCVSNGTLLKHDKIVLPDFTSDKTSSQWCTSWTKRFNSKIEKLFLYQKFRKESC